MHHIESAIAYYKQKFMLQNSAVLVYKGTKRVRGADTGEECVVVGVEKKGAVPYGTKVPKRLYPGWNPLKNVKTDVIEVGKINAFVARTSRARPAHGGMSIGHELITAGTLGAAVKYQDKRVILSNNHVLANSNSAAVGDNILQPGKYDGGTAADRIAKLLAFVPIKFAGSPTPDKCKLSNTIMRALNATCRWIGSQTVYVVLDAPQAESNKVDAAIAEPLSSLDVSDMILDAVDEPQISIKGISQPTVGMSVKKSGRTTGFKTGSISALNVTVNVGYGEGKMAQFDGQMLISPGGFSAGGDSGSTILDSDNKLVGLLFAGSDQVTIASPINEVFSALNLHL